MASSYIDCIGLVTVSSQKSKEEIDATFRYYEEQAQILKETGQCVQIEEASQASSALSRFVDNFSLWDVVEFFFFRDPYSASAIWLVIILILLGVVAHIRKQNNNKKSGDDK